MECAAPSGRRFDILASTHRLVQEESSMLPLLSKCRDALARLRDGLYCWGLVLSLAVLAGCQPPAAPPNTSQTTRPAAGGIDSEPAFITAAEGPAVFEPPPVDDLSGATLVEETWHAYTMQGSPVGYARTTIAKVVEQGRELVRTCSFMRLVVRREGQPVTQDMTLTSYDTPAGELVRFESRMTAGPSEVVSSGRAESGELTIEVNTLSSTQRQVIPWQANWGGFFAGEQSLRRQPLAPGEQRTVRCLLPVSNIPADIHLEAVGQESVELPSGPVKLLKVISTIDLGGQKIETFGWHDEQGVALKQYVPSIGQEAVQTTREAALAPGGTKNFTQAFATAAEVAQSKEGDCTEHAVLLAALARARDIPARGAMGLVYYPSGSGFAYHMWTEVWINDRWIPLDATLGRGGIGAAHFKLADSNLAGASAYSAMLPVIRVFGRLELEVVAAE
jgi:hypothetical protein